MILERVRKMASFRISPVTSGLLPDSVAEPAIS